MTNLKIGWLITKCYVQAWSEELATTAQRWADQCMFKHDKHRETLAGEYVGQNARLEELSQDVAGEEKVNRIFKNI